jgi:hypothetical protein
VTGPLATAIPPPVQDAVGFTGALTGFLMIASALGLRRGLRAAWYSTAVLLPITALQGFLQSSAFSVPLVVLSLLAIPNVLVHRRRFDRRADLVCVDGFGQVQRLVPVFVVRPALFDPGVGPRDLVVQSIQGVLRDAGRRNRVECVPDIYSHTRMIKRHIPTFIGVRLLSTATSLL